MREINIKWDMPCVDTAMVRLRSALHSGRAWRVPAIKIVHGYGSTGQGGKICTAVRAQLAREAAAGRIRGFVPGEEFGPFHPAARLLLDKDPTVACDRDFNRQNQGVTIVLF